MQTFACLILQIVLAQNNDLKAGYEYRVLATSFTHTMELELNRAAEDGFRFRTAMGGETSAGNEVVAVMIRRAGVRPRVSYKLLAASKTSTLEKELQAAADGGGPGPACRRTRKAAPAVRGVGAGPPAGPLGLSARRPPPVALGAAQLLFVRTVDVRRRRPAGDRGTGGAPGGPSFSQPAGRRFGRRTGG